MKRYTMKYKLCAVGIFWGCALVCMRGSDQIIANNQQKQPEKTTISDYPPDLLLITKNAVTFFEKHTTEQKKYSNQARFAFSLLRAKGVSEEVANIKCCERLLQRKSYTNENKVLEHILEKKYPTAHNLQILLTNLRFGLIQMYPQKIVKENELLVRILLFMTCPIWYLVWGCCFPNTIDYGSPAADFSWLCKKWKYNDAMWKVRFLKDD